jgi:uncharacterized membrane protein YeaQ/YmgE (transglycosylase-associated protein family)
MDRFPVIIVVGGMLLGWIAGTMAVTDPGILPFLPTTPAEKPGALPVVSDLLRYGAGLVGALLVLAIGQALKRRQQAPAAT